MSTEEKLRPLYVQVHPRDTVAIIVNEGGLPVGGRGAHFALRFRNRLCRTRDRQRQLGA
jgi:hypothetical protein